MRTTPSPSPSPVRKFLLVTLGLLILAAVLQATLRRRPDPPPSRGPLSASPSSLGPEVLAEFLAIEKREATVLTQAWRLEEEAQQQAQTIERFWDQLNQHRGELAPLLNPPARSVSLPAHSPAASLPLAITSWSSITSAAPALLPPTDPRLAAWASEGWGLDQSEWRHTGYQPATPDTPAASTFDVHLHLTRKSPPARAQVTARLRIAWPSASAPSGNPTLGVWTVEQFELIRRDGPPAFEEHTRIETPPFARTTWIDPLIAPRPAHNRPTQFLLAARNLRLVRSAEGAWSASALSPQHPGLIFTALLADFTGDDQEDLLCVVRNGMILLPGSPSLSFEQPARPAWLAPERLHYAQALTCGDIDGDGDLDVFLGQYRTPYEGGQMPRPFYDALDGPPAYLLRNLGDGRFEDATPESGLQAKRHRRSYGASFADLDADGDLDLLVSSDFAGNDLHLNDGSGRFTDHSAIALDDVRSFGMSHVFSDFDSDGALDFFVAGMPQPTADRLGGLGLERPEYPLWSAERSRLTVGNRLFFGKSGTYRQRDVGRDIARAGWAWSAAPIDLNQDRFPDLCVVNGHETRASVRDYEREFWLHDIYVGNSQPNPAVDAYFSSKFASTRSQGWSYGGYDKNRLFLNRAGSGFTEIGHVMGLALEDDCRNVLAEDFDGDGDTDLIVTTFAVWPTPRQTVRFLENTLPPQGHWIAIQPDKPPKLSSVIGATVTVNHRLGSQVTTLVTGDGYRSQGSGVARFGLAELDAVDSVEIRWPGGKMTRTSRLPANRVHRISIESPSR